MRLRLLGGIAAAALVLSGTAGANTINFGSVTNNTTTSLSGNSGDRSASSAASVNNGANDNVASASVIAQSSADQALSTDPTAIADILVSYDIPYTVTRTLSIAPCCEIAGPGIYTAIATVPTQTITFNVNWSGEVSKDNSQVGGGLGNAVAFTASFQSLGGLFTTGTYAGASQLGGGGLARTTVNQTIPDPSYGTSVNFSGAAVGEISLSAQIPTNYRMWSDFNPAYALNYGVTNNVTQSFSDTLRVTFRLRTESRASGSISTTGGEALACFGQTSPLGSFALDNSANCGQGFVINSSVAVNGTTTVPIPEPSTLGLLGAALAGLAYFGARHRR